MSMREKLKYTEKKKTSWIVYQSVVKLNLNICGFVLPHKVQNTSKDDQLGTHHFYASHKRVFYDN